MSDDNSNDVVMVENTDAKSDTADGTAQKETRPLMKLFERLISNDNKQNTILTNAQIVSILLKEFDIDIVTLHELEVDIYLNVVKRFLKDWPKWDEFDQGINALRTRRSYSQKSVKKTLEAKYVDLKEYLRLQLEATKPLAQKAVSDMLNENAKRMKKVDTSEMVLEVVCTRKHLNELVLSQPSYGDVESNIFNFTDWQPTSISLNKVPIEAALNWLGVKITIDCTYLGLVRQTKHELKHTLVNAKNGPRGLLQELNTKLQYKEGRRSMKVLKDKLFQTVHKVFQSQIPSNTESFPIFHLIIKMLVRDFESVLEVNVPGSYRQHTNKYPYYRKLRKQPEQSTTATSNYDLYIEEVMLPRFCTNISLVQYAEWKVALMEKFFVTVECTECNIKFNSTNMFAEIKEHFDTYHYNEPDCICSNCEKSFTMNYLAMNNWHHEC